MTLFHLWDLPGDVLAAPESVSGLDRCNISLSNPAWAEIEKGWSQEDTPGTFREELMLSLFLWFGKT